MRWALRAIAAIAAVCCSTDAATAPAIRVDAPTVSAIRLMAKRRPDAKAMEKALHAIEARLGPDTDEAADGPSSNQVTDQVKYLGNGVLERHPNSRQRRANLYTAYRAVNDAPPPRH